MTIINMQSVQSNRDEQGLKRLGKVLLESSKRNRFIPTGPGNGDLKRLSTRQLKTAQDIDFKG